MFYRETFPISRVSSRRRAPIPDVRQQKVAGTRGWQPAKNYAFRSFVREQQFTAIYDIRGVEAHSSEGRSAGLAETRHRTPPRWKSAAAVGGSHSPSIAR